MALAAQTQTRQISREGVAYTLEAILPGIQSNAFDHTVYGSIFLGTLIDDMTAIRSMNGRSKQTQEGGERVLVRHTFGKSPNTKNLASGWDTYSTGAADVVRQSEAEWKHYADAVTVSLTDRLKNRGPSAFANLVAHLAENAMSSLVDMVVGHGYSGTAGTALTGLDSIIGANDSVQGVSGATYANWNSWGVSGKNTAAASVSFASGSFSAQGIADMRSAYTNARYGSNRPNVILTTEDIEQFYEGSLVPQERYAAPATTGDAGFTGLAFKTAPVFGEVFATSGVMYFLNTDKVFVVCLAGADFEPQPPEKAQEQEADSQEIVFKGAQVTTDRRMLNKLTGITA